jgi:hypothetical protein
VKLEKFDERYEKEALAVHKGTKVNQPMIDSFMKTFQEWTDKIEKAINYSNSISKQRISDQQGPRDELDYWKTRMRMLTQISEQIRGKNIRTVYNVLQATSQNEINKHGDSGIFLALSNWRTIELSVTENLNESKDNVKYL